MKSHRSVARIMGLVLILTTAVTSGVLAQVDVRRPVLAAPAGTSNVIPSRPVDSQVASPPARPVVADTLSPSDTRFSPWTGEIVKLAHAGIGAGVMLAYIDNCAGTFNLDADDIIRLSGSGVPSRVISMMIQHDAELACGVRTLTASTVPGSTVHLTFSAASGASVRTGEAAATTPRPAGPEVGARGEMAKEESGSDVEDLSFLSELELALNEGNGFERSATPEQAVARGYSIRQPYPEEVLPPVLVVKAAVRTPNVLVIEFSPEPAAGKPETASGKAHP
jgi:hypothetical protein